MIGLLAGDPIAICANHIHNDIRLSRLFWEGDSGFRGLTFFF